MQGTWLPRWCRIWAARAACGLLLTASASAAGCATWPFRSDPPAQPALPPARPAPSSPAASNDNPRLTLVNASPAEAGRHGREVRLDVSLRALHVLVPSAERARADTVWNHVREDVVSGETALRLRRNGLRIGIGNEQFWDPIQAALDAIPGVRTVAVDPVRVPPNYPMAFELDMAPQEQTLFYVGEDGILSGETWPQSRNVLRVSYELNLQHADRLRFIVVPEVRQRLDGWRWVRGELGMTQVPNYAGRAFAAAGFTLDLEPGDFLLVAPSEQSDIYGLVGSRFLAREEDGRRYDSYVFLRAEVNHVAQRN